MKTSYSAGISTVFVVAGVFTTRRFTSLYSAGTSTRHMISPVPLSTFSIRPRPFFHVTYAGRTSTFSVTIS